MKKYKCHKIVEAEPMTRAEWLFENNKISEENAANMEAEMGYRVVYKDGYISWSPKEAFEEGYTLIE